MQLERRGFLFWAGTMAITLSGARARASLARAVTLARLVRSSERAVVATAVDAHSRWETVGRKKRIVTYTRIRVDETLGGPEDQELMVRTLGGQVGAVGQVVHGEAVLILGEPAILFLATDADATPLVTEMAQGHYPVRAANDGERRVFPSPRLSEIDLGADSAVRQLVGRRLDDARSLVRKAWRDAR
jgi:hypothetical protein